MPRKAKKIVEETPVLTDEEPQQPLTEDALQAESESDDEKKASATNALVPTDSLQRYFSEIRRYPLLTPAEEHELAVRYKEQGDREAAYRLVTGNLRLVVMIARNYQQAFRNLLDLIQEGNIGLMEAVRHFDPYRGVRFPSYAVWWIRAYVIRYIMNNWRMVKLGTTQAQRKLFFNLQKEKNRLEAEGFTAGPKLLAQNLGVKEEEVIEMEQRMSSRDLSIDTPAGDEEDSSPMLDFLADKQATTEEEVAATQYRQVIRAKMEEFARTLKGKEEIIFNKRLLAEEPLTLQEIGDQYSISRERVRQLESRLKQKLKTYLSREIKDLSVELTDAR